MKFKFKGEPDKEYPDMLLEFALQGESLEISIHADRYDWLTWDTLDIEEAKLLQESLSILIGKWEELHR